MANCVFASKFISFSWLILKSVVSSVISMTGYSCAGSIANVNRLLPDFISAFSFCISNSSAAPSGKARHISSSFLAGKVSLVVCSNLTSISTINSTSISVAVIDSRLGFILKSKLERIGSVWRRSTFPPTRCNPGNNSSLLILKFIYTPIIITIS